MADPEKPIGRQRLDVWVAEGCHDCGAPAHRHQPLVLHPRCHRLSPTWVFYGSDGILRVRCAKCDRLVAAVWVGEAPA